MLIGEEPAEVGFLVLAELVGRLFTTEVAESTFQGPLLFGWER